MKDRFWHAVYECLRPLVNETDVVLAPRGDWPPFPCACTFYDDVIDIAGVSLLVLHKGRIGGLESKIFDASPLTGSGYLPTKFSWFSVVAVKLKEMCDSVWRSFIAGR